MKVPIKHSHEKQNNFIQAKVCINPHSAELKLLVNTKYKKDFCLVLDFLYQEECDVSNKRI